MQSTFVEKKPVPSLLRCNRCSSSSANKTAANVLRLTPSSFALNVSAACKLFGTRKRHCPLYFVDMPGSGIGSQSFWLFLSKISLLMEPHCKYDNSKYNIHSLMINK